MSEKGSNEEVGAGRVKEEVIAEKNDNLGDAELTEGARRLCSIGAPALALQPGQGESAEGRFSDLTEFTGKGTWLAKEDKLLQDIVEKRGIRYGWNNMARELPINRTGKQIGEHYHKVLKPRLEKLALLASCSADAGAAQDEPVGTGAKKLEGAGGVNTTGNITDTPQGVRQHYRKADIGVGGGVQCAGEIRLSVPVSHMSSSRVLESAAPMHMQMGVDRMEYPSHFHAQHHALPASIMSGHGEHAIVPSVYPTNEVQHSSRGVPGVHPIHSSVLAPVSGIVLLSQLTPGTGGASAGGGRTAHSTNGPSTCHSQAWGAAAQPQLGSAKDTAANNIKTPQAHHQQPALRNLEGGGSWPTCAGSINALLPLPVPHMQGSGVWASATPLNMQMGAGGYMQNPSDYGPQYPFSSQFKMFQRSNMMPGTYHPIQTQSIPQLSRQSLQGFGHELERSFFNPSQVHDFAGGEGGRRGQQLVHDGVQGSVHKPHSGIGVRQRQSSELRDVKPPSSPARHHEAMPPAIANVMPHGSDGISQLTHVAQSETARRTLDSRTDRRGDGSLRAPVRGSTGSNCLSGGMGHAVEGIQSSAVSNTHGLQNIDEWTHEENVALRDAQRQPEFQNQWALIVPLLPSRPGRANRTPNAIRNRWRHPKMIKWLQANPGAGVQSVPPVALPTAAAVVSAPPRVVAQAVNHIQVAQAQALESVPAMPASIAVVTPQGLTYHVQSALARRLLETGAYMGGGGFVDRVPVRGSGRSAHLPEGAGHRLRTTQETTTAHAVQPPSASASAQGHDTNDMAHTFDPHNQSSNKRSQDAEPYDRRAQKCRHTKERGAAATAEGGGSSEGGSTGANDI